MRPKRALVIVHSYYLRDTRARRHGTALAEAGWQVEVVCARDTNEPLVESSGSTRIWRLPTRRRGGSPQRRVFEYLAFAAMGLLAVSALWLCRRHRLVYVLGMPNFVVFCALVPRVAGSRVLLDMRDPFPEFFLAKYEASTRHPMLRLLLAEERLSARFASSVLTAVPSMAELYERSIDRGRIEVVWNTADPRLFGPRFLRPEPGDRTLLYVGTVTHPYGVDLAVRAVVRLHDQIAGLRIRIVGHGDLTDLIANIAVEAGISHLVHVEDSVPHDEVPAILESAWLGVQPIRPSSLMEHSLSTKILEWCSAGLPVIAGSTPPLEALFGDDTILFHRPGDLDGLCACICEAHGDPDALALRVERARKAAARISFEEQVDAFLRSAEGA